MTNLDTKKLDNIDAFLNEVGKHKYPARRWIYRGVGDVEFNLRPVIGRKLKGEKFKRDYIEEKERQLLENLQRRGASYPNAVELSIEHLLGFFRRPFVETPFSNSWLRGSRNFRTIVFDTVDLL